MEPGNINAGDKPRRYREIRLLGVLDTDGQIVTVDGDTGEVR